MGGGKPQHYCMVMGINLADLGNIDQAVPVTAEKELAAAFQTRQGTVHRDLLVIRQVEK